MKNNPSWDDIPALDDVDVDWNFKPTTPLGKRAFVRIHKEDIPRLFTVSQIFVKVATADQTYTGEILDISVGGLLLAMPVPLEENLPLKVGFYLGPVKIIAKALVRHSRKIEEQYAIGIQFIDLDSDSAGYINGLYASLVMRY